MSFPHMVVPRMPVPTSATRRFDDAGAAQAPRPAIRAAAAVPEAAMNSRRVTALSSAMVPSAGGIASQANGIGLSQQ